MIDQIRETAGSWSSSVEEGSERVRNLTATVREELARGATVMRDYAQNQPVRALGLAFGMGVFLGWLIKRD